MMSTSFIFLTDDDVMDLAVVMKLEEGVVHIEVVADSVRSIDQVRPT